MPEGRYTADDIQVLEFAEAVRVRPSMYVGDPLSSAALINVTSELLCISIDAMTGGPARHVEFTLLDDDCVEVSNDGRGLPLGTRAIGSKEVSIVELIMTRLHACRAMKEDELHKRWCHVGIAAMCALSDWSVVTVRRDGGTWEQRFARGKATTELVRIGDASTTGTSIRFKPDRTILKGEFDVPLLRSKIAEFTRDVPCIEVTFRNLRGTPFRE